MMMMKTMINKNNNETPHSIPYHYIMLYRKTRMYGNVIIFTSYANELSDSCLNNMYILAFSTTLLVHMCVSAKHTAQRDEPMKE